MEKSIEGAKKLIELQVSEEKIWHCGKIFSRYSKTYFWTNENISEYLDLVSFEGKESALAVCASGDHTFNLINKGITNIDTFDINSLTEYFAFGFKRAMILKYEYDEFLTLMEILRSQSISLEALSDIIFSLLPYMDIKHRIFWNAIIDFNYKIQREHGTNLNLFKMIGFEHTPKRLLTCNNYLKDKENFEKLKSRLGNVNIAFKNADAINLTEVYEGNHYDFILLSNIIDYFTKYWRSSDTSSKLLDYLRDLENISSKDAVIFLKYIFRYAYYTPEGERVILPFINNSKNTSDNFTEEVHEIASANSAQVMDGMVLKRIKHQGEKE